MSGLFSWIGCLFSADARYNRDLYKTGKANKNIKVYTSIRPDLGEDRNTASGFVERSRPVDSGPSYTDWDDTDRQ